MNIKNSWRREIPLLILDVIIIALFALFVCGVRANLTPSLPRGIYQITLDVPEIGDMAYFCLDQDNPYSSLAQERSYLGPGSCPSGLKPLLKIVAGLPGDLVELKPNGIALNGRLLAGTERPENDSAGRIIPVSLLVPGYIPAGQALMLSPGHPGGFDGRHFGLVPIDSLTKVRPLWVEGE